MELSVSRCTISVVSGLSLFLAMPAQSKILIATAATISAVWKSANPRDTIKLSGTFGLTRLQYKSSAKGITLDATGAVFTDTLVINKVDGLNIIGGKFGATGGGPTKYGRAVVVYGGSRISFNQPVVVGEAGGSGIAFSDTVNATVKLGTFSGLHAAITFARVTNGYLNRNTITGALSDGIDIADSHSVTATYNSCGVGSPGAGAHPDCIQLWSVAGHPVQSDILIAHNTATGPTQGFTSFDPAKGGGLRISIMYNRVATTYSQGIACYACVDSNISYNKVTTLAGAPHMTNINIIGGSDNIVVGNTIGPLPKSTPNAQLALATFDPRLDASGIFDGGGGAPGEAVGPVPEPASWLVMIMGFGIVGIAARRSRTLAVVRSAVPAHRHRVGASVT